VRREYKQLAVVILASVAVRALLFSRVGIWGDAGFYVYDARLILDGQVPFRDFIGRSPLFNYAFAAVVSQVGNNIEVLRLFILFWWFLSAVPVYIIGKHVKDHKTGLLAVIIFELSPFMLFYGYWANTQSLSAFFAVSAVAVVLTKTDWKGFCLGGGLLGLGFLVRRSVIVILAAFGLYAIYIGYLQADIRQPVVNGSSLLVGFVGILGAGYGLLASGDIALAWKFAETHAWGLISSSGRGGFPLLTEQRPPSVEIKIDGRRIPIFHDVCQLCGQWMFRVFLKTSIAAVLVVAPLLIYARDIVERLYPENWHWWIGMGTLLVVMYIAYGTVLSGHYLRVLAIFSWVLFGYIVSKIDLPSADLLYNQEIVLPLLVLCGLSAGYLYRNRIIHTYYFADFMPYLAVVAAVCYIHIYNQVLEHE